MKKRDDFGEHDYCDFCETLLKNAEITDAKTGEKKDICNDCVERLKSEGKIRQV